jgi:hypothetical protein
MRNGIIDIPDSDKFIRIDSSICQPIQISHRIEFRIESTLSPDGKEWTMDSTFFDKSCYNGFNF